MEERLTKQEIEAVDKAMELFYKSDAFDSVSFADWFLDYKASIAVKKEKYRTASEVLREYCSLFLGGSDAYEEFRSFINIKLEE